MIIKHTSLLTLKNKNRVHKFEIMLDCLNMVLNLLQCLLTCQDRFNFSFVVMIDYDWSFSA